MTSLVVQKYGGTSVASPEMIAQVASQIAERRRSGDRLVVVVSAMGKTTDELQGLALQVSPEPWKREMDMLLSVGERISMALLSMALREEQISAISLTGSQSGILTSSQHGGARIDEIRPERIQAALDLGDVVIVAGFQGVSREKEITTLGRGGSDTTAVALAVVLGADVCEIYSDVDGLYTADPRVVPNARELPTLSFLEAEELAVGGVQILHPRSVALARQHEMPLVVRRSFQTKGGSVIQKATGSLECSMFLGVTHADQKLLIWVELSRATVQSAVWGWSRAQGLDVFAPQFRGQDLLFFADREAVVDWKSGLESLTTDGFVKKFELLDEWIPLTIVGSGFGGEIRALDQVIETLAQEEISTKMFQVSPSSIVLAVPRNRAEEGVRALHRGLIENEKGSA